MERPIRPDMTLADISSEDIYIWYTNIKCKKTVEIINYLKCESEKGRQIFYPIYSKDEVLTDSAKKNTGIFFFRGKIGKRFAIMNAGGGFEYVGAMHDSFPQALEVSRKGYNCFATIYRPKYAYEDLARAIFYIYTHASELQIAVDNYSIWGGSAGARMAIELGKKNAMEDFGYINIPSASAVITQYTGYTATSINEAPTYACVGTNDCAVNWHIMKERLSILSNYGIPTKFRSFEGLQHGFGIGLGTLADGWINEAISFWEHNMI